MREFWCFICAVNSLGGDITIRCSPDRLKNLTTIWPSHCRTWHPAANSSADSVGADDKHKQLSAAALSTSTSSIASFFKKSTPSSAGASSSSASAPIELGDSGMKLPRRDGGRTRAKHDELRTVMAPVFAELRLPYRAVEKPKFRALVTTLGGGRFVDAVSTQCVSVLGATHTAHDVPCRTSLGRLASQSVSQC
jgi:hypothetical protein